VNDEGFLARHGMALQGSVREATAISLAGDSDDHSRLTYAEPAEMRDKPVAVALTDA